ncbi:MAG: hypothetical protein IPL40_03150 [Proteobacteria bacterium]|nr:hypothetical protein [Pseudomonadota bacterium]
MARAAPPHPSSPASGSTGSSAAEATCWWAVGGALLATVALWLHARWYTFVTDDAYITFRYSWNLATHGQPVFNLGERVEGYTNFLWMLLLALGLRLGVAPELVARVLATLAATAVLGLVVALSRLYRGGRATPWDALGALWLASAAHFAAWCGGGLETQLFSALALGGIVLYAAELAARPRDQPRRAVAGGLLFALATLTRPEGALLWGLTSLHRLACNLREEGRLRPSRAEWSGALAFLLPCAAFFVWRWRYYGYPLPNTFYVKAQGQTLVMLRQWGWPYLRDFFGETKLWCLAPLLLALLALRWRVVVARRAGQRARADERPATTSCCAARSATPGGALAPSRWWSYWALLVVPYVGYIAMVGGDFMTLGRFFVPLLPLFALLGQELLRELCDRPTASQARGWRPARALPVIAGVLALSAWNSVGLARQSRAPSYYRWGLDTPGYLEKFAADRMIIGRWLRAHLPADALLAAGGAGSIAYASRLPVLDAFGLNDAWIAHHAPISGTRPGHAKAAPLDYVLERRADLICHLGHHQDLPYRPDAAEEQAWRARGYHWICLDPGSGLRPRYYCCLKRLDRELGPFPAELGS